MIGELLPGAVTVAATTGDIDTELAPAEQAVVGNAIDKRRVEFVTGRALARQALRRIGVEAASIASGPKGDPVWPAGIVGSITHCAGYRACAVARAEEVGSVGIDAEVHAPLPGGVLEDVASLLEQQRLRAAAREGLHLDRVLFSAKEAVYKAWFPLAGRWLGFEDVDMEIGLHDGTWAGRLLVPGPLVGDVPLAGFGGRWAVRSGIVLTAVTVPAPR